MWLVVVRATASVRAALYIVSTDQCGEVQCDEVVSIKQLVYFVGCREVV